MVTTWGGNNVFIRNRAGLREEKRRERERERERETEVGLESIIGLLAINKAYKKLRTCRYNNIPV